MPLKAEGIAVLVALIVIVILLFLLGVYCHFCAENESGGHYYRSNENITSVVFVGKKNGAGPTRNKCKCSNKFKGSCKRCQGEDFVDDGDDGAQPDFTDFGGDQGLDPGWGNKPDPIRSALGGGGGMGSNSGGGGGDTSGYGASESSGMMMRDD